MGEPGAKGPVLSRSLPFAFRFLVSWLVLLWQGPFVIQLPIIGYSLFKLYEPIWSVLVAWFARFVLGLSRPVDLESVATGSSDGLAMWVQDLLILVLSILIALVWTALRRMHTPSPRAWAWLTLVMRVLLAWQMLIYGFVKAFPNQMPEPRPSQLVTRFGDFSPMQVLWTQMGAAPWYETTTGVIEITCAVLLALPRAWVLGAALATIALAQITLLDIFYDVPAKLLVTHLLAMALVLLAPHLGRIWNVLVANRGVDPPPPQTLTSRHRWDRIVNIAAAVLVAAVGALQAVENYAEYSSFISPSAPKPPLYGAWRPHTQPAAFAYFSINGYSYDALTSGTTNPRNAQVVVALELPSGVKEYLSGVIKPAEHTITLTDPKKPDQPPAVLHYDQPDPNQLALTGDWNGQHLDLTLDKIDLGQLPLNKDRGIHWIQEAPQ